MDIKEIKQKSAELNIPLGKGMLMFPTYYRDVLEKHRNEGSEVVNHILLCLKLKLFQHPYGKVAYDSWGVGFEPKYLDLQLIKHKLLQRTIRKALLTTFDLQMILDFKGGCWYLELQCTDEGEEVTDLSMIASISNPRQILEHLYLHNHPVWNVNLDLLWETQDSEKKNVAEKCGVDF